MQRFRCLQCAKTFSVNPLDGLRLEKSKLVQIVKLLSEGLGVRGTARVTDCDPHTVLNVLQTIGQKCEALHDRLVRNVQTEALQLDEIWTRVRCTQKRANFKKYGDEFGDQYTYLGIAAKEKLIVSFHTGKRNVENTDAFVCDLSRRIDGHVQVTTDSYRPYQTIVRNHLGGRLDYATMQKLYALPHNARQEAVRRYSPSVCTGVRIRVQEGTPAREKINTSFIERSNLSVRHFNKRFARLTLGYSKTLENHRYAIALFVTAYNFCKVHSTLRSTPAVAAKVVAENWTIERLIEAVTAP